MAHRIALIRHGQTAWSKSGQHTSTTDIDLTEEGVYQAMTIPSLLWGLDLAPATVWSSPRLRAQRTATLAGLHINKVVDDLAEWAYGDYEGITSPEIRKTNPDWSIFIMGAPGGESPEDVATRCDRVLEKAKQRLDRGDVALFCHGHISRVLAMRWVGLPVANGGLILMNPAAITVLGTYHEKPCIEHANVVPFRAPLISQTPDAGFVDDYVEPATPVGVATVDTSPAPTEGDAALGHA
ncbi:MAG: histidine phosphatase family protein [Nakamurella sp.]